jgi:hypothetical protein
VVPGAASTSPHIKPIEVKMESRRFHAACAAALLTMACGGSTPLSPVPMPTATPAPAATPTPAPAPTPTPTPEPCAECEPATVNTARPVRLTLRLYAIEDGLGHFLQNISALDVIPLGWYARLDVVGKDADGEETNGTAEVEWHFSECCLVKVSGNHTHQRRLKVLEPGYLDVWVTQHGVRSNTISLSLAN